MSKFDTYFLMTTEDAIEYAKVKVPQMEWDSGSMTCREIGDGNLNYVLKLQMTEAIALLLSRQVVWRVFLKI